MRKTGIAAGIVGGAFLLSAWAAAALRGPVGNRSVPQPLKAVELYRYMGRWYEQYRYEAWFERDMDEVTADYALHEDGSVEVVNRGRRGAADGSWKQSLGKARVADTASHAKLKVSFFGPFYGDYWILDHGEDYDWSIVGEPSGRYLWVLTRVLHPAGDVLSLLEERVKALGYDWSLVRKTKQ